MYELVSIAHTSNYFARPTLYFEHLQQQKTNGLLITNSVHENDLIKALFRSNNQTIIEHINMYDFIATIIINTSTLNL